MHLVGFYFRNLNFNLSVLVKKKVTSMNAARTAYIVIYHTMAKLLFKVKITSAAINV